jgi:hypothetical protein
VARGNTSDKQLILGFLEYLLAHGTATLSDILPSTSPWQEYAKDHDLLGWDNFLEGRMALSLLKAQRDLPRHNNCQLSKHNWVATLVQHLLGISHRQWVYQNTKVHLKLKEGRSLSEHEAIMEEVWHMMAVDPDDLLPCHQSLLQEDYKQLGEAPTTYRLQ